MDVIFYFYRKESMKKTTGESEPTHKESKDSVVIFCQNLSSFNIQNIYFVAPAETVSLMLMSRILLTLRCLICQALIEETGSGCSKAGKHNPGLKCNQSINFSCMKLLFTAYVFCSLRLLKFNTEEQTM